MSNVTNILPIMICVAAPSGAGKSSFVERIAREIPILFDTVTYTTRPMREGESQGQPYYFIDETEFKKKVSDNFFVEHAIVHGRMYGTSRIQIEEAFSAGRPVIMDVDVQGVDTFKKVFPFVKSIFILPPSLPELRLRLARRDSGKTYDLDLRLKNAEAEIKRAIDFDFQVVNDQFEPSYQLFKKIVVGIIGHT